IRARLRPPGSGSGRRHRRARRTRPSGRVPGSPPLRILVHEFVSGGGLSGRPLPPTLAREGAAMLGALLADLAAVPGLEIVATTDPRTRLRVPPGVEAVPLPPTRPAATLRRLIRAADAVWLIAPETDGILARLAARVEAEGRPLLGPSAAAIRAAADKAALRRRLAAAGVAGPPARTLPRAADPRAMAADIEYPVVVKPARGAGCGGVGLARDAAEFARAVALARAAGAGRLLAQPFLPGAAASVSLIGDGSRAFALAVNAQHVPVGLPFAYDGGATPLEHPRAARAVECALAAYRALPGLVGYVGIDLVVSDAGPVVTDVNPRLTTAYLGVRAALDVNIAALALDACLGRLPPPSGP